MNTLPTIPESCVQMREAGCAYRLRTVWKVAGKTTWVSVPRRPLGEISICEGEKVLHINRKSNIPNAANQRELSASTAKMWDGAISIEKKPNMKTVVSFIVPTKAVLAVPPW